MSASPIALSEAACVVRSTNSKHGRTIWLKPGSGAVTYLHYGRIILEPGADPVRFSTGNLETGVICLKGSAAVQASAKTFDLGLYDALYVPRATEISITPGASGCDLAEIAAPVDNAYPLQFVPFSEVQSDPGLHFRAGASGSERDLNILLGKNIQAGRIVAGVTFSEPGNWTSWPPHEHAQMLEEAYVYIDMPHPAWGLQLVYTNPDQPELAVVVREGDCVVMPRGYHPNVAAPGGSINFLWMMAAHREVADRQFGVVNVQPEYAARSSGLETGRAAK